ncbi:MFS transporter [Paenisporosarcina sp. FSL H8-0542]|uniref:MFS transporter n=1 Tax=Paenisporosarcina sp. FSL H8-0542 TaxID=2921401 RepID=UPI00315AD816
MNKQSNKSSIWTKSFINIAVSNFFIFVVFYALLTLMPMYALDLPGGTVSKAGLVTTIFLLSVILVRPFSGLILEKFGRKRMLGLSMLAFAVSTFSYVLTEDIKLLLILRFIHGVSFSIATTVTLSIAADIVPPERRGEGLGYFGMSMNLAVVVGPFIALTLQPLISYHSIFLIFGVIMIIGWLCGVFVKDTLQAIQPSAKRKLSWSDLFERKALAISSVGIFVSFAYASIMSFISLYAQSIGLIETASYFFLVFAAAMLISRPITGRLFDTMGPNIIIIPSILIFAAGLFVLSLASSAWMLLLAGALIGLGYGTLLPSFQTLAIQASPNRRSAYATATFFTLFDTGIAVGSFVLGIAVAYMGYANLYMALGGFVVLIVFYYKWIMKEK